MTGESVGCVGWHAGEPAPRNGLSPKREAAFPPPLSFLFLFHTSDPAPRRVSLSHSRSHTRSCSPARAHLRPCPNGDHCAPHAAGRIRRPVRHRRRPVPQPVGDRVAGHLGRGGPAVRAALAAGRARQAQPGACRAPRGCARRRGGAAGRGGRRAGRGGGVWQGAAWGGWGGARDACDGPPSTAHMHAPPPPSRNTLPLPSPLPPHVVHPHRARRACR